jgi:hypothetical protein
MFRPSPIRRYLSIASILIVAASVAVCSFLFGCEHASASGTGVVHVDRQDDGAGSSEVAQRNHRFPRGGPQPLPEALASSGANEINLQKDESKPAPSFGWIGSRRDQLTGRQCGLLGSRPTAIPTRSLQILFCSWLI